MVLITNVIFSPSDDASDYSYQQQYSLQVHIHEEQTSCSSVHKICPNVV